MRDASDDELGPGFDKAETSAEASRDSSICWAELDAIPVCQNGLGAVRVCKQPRSNNVIVALSRLVLRCSEERRRRDLPCCTCDANQGSSIASAYNERSILLCEDAAAGAKGAYPTVNETGACLKVETLSQRILKSQNANIIDQNRAKILVLCSCKVTRSNVAYLLRRGYRRAVAAHQLQISAHQLRLQLHLLVLHGSLRMRKKENSAGKNAGQNRQP